VDHYAEWVRRSPRVPRRGLSATDGPYAESKEYCLSTVGRPVDDDVSATEIVSDIHLS
jgi:hypothetical protein